jgi:hypothetical protein
VTRATLSPVAVSAVSSGAVHRGIVLVRRNHAKVVAS